MASGRQRSRRPGGDRGAINGAPPPPPLESIRPDPGPARHGRTALRRGRSAGAPELGAGCPAAITAAAAPEVLGGGNKWTVMAAETPSCAGSATGGAQKRAEFGPGAASVLAWLIPPVPLLRETPFPGLASGTRPSGGVLRPGPRTRSPP